MLRAVATCDFIQSRELDKDHRKQVRDFLRNSYQIARKSFSKDTIEKLSFRVVEGDEFQIVINDPIVSYKFILLLRNHINISDDNIKYNFRCSIGIGTIAIDSSRSTYGMDGEAFHLSRDGLEDFENDKDKSRNRMTIITTEFFETNDDINTVCGFLDMIELHWSYKQKQIIHWLLRGKNVNEISNRLNRSKPSIYRSIQRARWKQFESGMDFIEEKIKLYINEIYDAIHGT